MNYDFSTGLLIRVFFFYKPLDKSVFFTIIDFIEVGIRTYLPEIMAVPDAPLFLI